MTQIQVQIKKTNENAILPKIAKMGDAGADCYINGFKKIILDHTKALVDLPKQKSYHLKPLERVLCPLGFSTAIPKGYYAALVPRSGLALWSGLSICNTPATIDAGYRNEWGAILINLSNKNIILNIGDRVCQLIIRKVVDYTFIETEDLSDSDRGMGGYGSTGI